MKYFWIVMFVVLVTIGYYISTDKNTNESREVNTSEKTVENGTEYYDENGSTVTIRHVSEGEAIFSGLGFDSIEMTETKEETGTRYEAKEGKISIINNNKRVSVFDGGELIFSGSDDLNLILKQEQELTSVTESAERIENISTQELLSTYTWIWMKTVHSDGKVISPLETARFVVTFSEDGSINGSTDCNGFSGEYKLTDDSLLISPLMSTMMACEDSQEGEFTSSFSNTERVSFTEEEDLIIHLKDGGAIFFQKDLIEM